MYGESKLRGELYLEELKGKLPYVIVRPPIVYGPRDKNVFVLFKTVSKQWMPLLGAKSPTGHKYYSIIHVDDLIRALILLLQAPEELFRNGERFFVNDGQIYTYERMLGLIAQELKVKPIQFKVPTGLVAALAFGGTALGRVLKRNLPLNRDKLNEILPDYWICSSQKAIDMLGFRPEYTMETGVAQTIAWYKVQGWL